MRTLRAILVLLLSVSLPWSAGATMVENLHCHHDGLGALIDDTGAMHHDRAAMTQHHDAADQGCDCAVKCQCQHHCASASGIAVTSLATAALSFPSGSGESAAGYAGVIPSAVITSPFRPPIVAPPGAA